jgi:hypothetical protein
MLRSPFGLLVPWFIVKYRGKAFKKRFSHSVRLVYTITWSCYTVDTKRVLEYTQGYGFDS